MRALFPLVALIALPVHAQTLPDPAPAATPTPVPATVLVRIVTSAGPIVLALEKERAPLTTANFLRYVDQRRLDGTSFYRAMKLGGGQGLIQGGIRNDGKRALPPVAHEPTTKTGILHTEGTISLASAGPGTGRGDIFITLSTMPALDAKPGGRGSDAGYAAFGHIVEGLDIARGILDAPTSPTAGEGAMKGQMIAAPVRILTVRRVVPLVRRR